MKSFVFFQDEILSILMMIKNNKIEITNELSFYKNSLIVKDRLKYSL